MNDETTLNQAIALASADYTGDATVTWRQSRKVTRYAVAGPDLLHEELYLANRIREGNQYPRKRSYQGLFHFSAIDAHVWFESLLEASRLAGLEMSGRVVAIASQPCLIKLLDGSIHYPDYLVLTDSGRQVLIDVKPRRKVVDDQFVQFAKASAVCRRIGWGYQVLTEYSETEEANVTFLRQYKHVAFHPGAEREQILRARLFDGATVGDAVGLLAAESTPRGRAEVLHLIWSGSLAIDMQTCLSDDSTVREASR